MAENATFALLDYFSKLHIHAESKAKTKKGISLIILAHVLDGSSFFFHEHFPRDILKLIIFDYVLPEYHFKQEKLLKYVQKPEIYQELSKQPQHLSLMNTRNWYLGTQRIFDWPRKSGKTYKLCQAVSHLVLNFNGERTLNIMVVTYGSLGLNEIKEAIRFRLLQKITLVPNSWSVLMENDFNKRVKIIYINAFCTVRGLPLVDAIFFDDYDRFCQSIYEPQQGIEKSFKNFLEDLPILTLAMSTPKKRNAHEALDRNSDDMADLRG